MVVARNLQGEEVQVNEPPEGITGVTLMFYKYDVSLEGNTVALTQLQNELIEAARVFYSLKPKH